MAAVRVNVFGDIAPALIQHVYATLGQAKVHLPAGPAKRQIELFINSGGGDVGSALSCYNLLRASGLYIVSFNIGECSSAANVIFLAGDERYAAKHISLNTTE
jgi:ATP-dependent protease ClpP protease subunit